MIIPDGGKVVHDSRRIIHGGGKVIHGGGKAVYGAGRDVGIVGWKPVGGFFYVHAIAQLAA